MYCGKCIVGLDINEFEIHHFQRVTNFWVIWVGCDVYSNLGAFEIPQSKSNLYDINLLMWYFVTLSCNIFMNMDQHCIFSLDFPRLLNSCCWNLLLLVYVNLINIWLWYFRIRSCIYIYNLLLIILVDILSQAAIDRKFYSVSWIKCVIIEQKELMNQLFFCQSKECLEKVAETIRYISRPGESYVLLLTGKLRLSARLINYSSADYVVSVLHKYISTL